MIWEAVRILRRSDNPYVWSREPFVLLDKFQMVLSLKFISNPTNITYLPWHWLIKEVLEENIVLHSADYVNRTCLNTSIRKEVIKKKAFKTDYQGK
jgi:hypothetical protein